MRISAGSRGLSRNGGNIHVHPEIPFITIRPRIQRSISQSIPLAPLEIRDAIFQELIRISPASNYMEELVAGPGGLLSRGLLEEDAKRYGALPRTKQERAVLAGIVNYYACVQFPEYAKSYSGAGVLGVPGFWQELSGVVRIWKPRKHAGKAAVVTGTSKGIGAHQCGISRAFPQRRKHDQKYFRQCGLQSVGFRLIGMVFHC